MPPEIEGEVNHEAALVILVPEADALVGSFRELYDPAANLGMPAHITINYPFNAYSNDKPGVLDELGKLFLKYPCFQFCLNKIRSFPGVLYLAPEPEHPFVQLAKAVWEKFPDSPPYDGVHEGIIPHLTFAHIEDRKLNNSVCEEFLAYSKGRLPVCATARVVWLMGLHQGKWGKREAFELSAKTRQ